MSIGRRGALGGVAALAAGHAWAPARAQGKTAIKITRQPSIIYMPTFIMEGRRLIETRAAQLGAPGVTVEWVTFNGGGAATDALLADSVDIVNTGCGNMLLLWDRTRGRVKGIAATCAEPLVLISREPRIQSIEDFRPGDKIAVPTVKVSTQAILLQIACVKTWGEKSAGRLDANTVQLGHPDAMAALLNARGEIGSHFSAPPFFAEELKRVPGAHVITDSNQILGEPLSQAILFTTTKFAEANPKIIRAVKEATAEAVTSIRTDAREAVRTYRKASGDPMPEAALLDVLGQPGMLDFFDRPQGTMRFARHLYQTGVLKTEPKAWTDYFLPIAAGLGGS